MHHREKRAKYHEQYEGLENFSPPNINDKFREQFKKDTLTKDFNAKFKQQLACSALGAVKVAFEAYSVLPNKVRKAVLQAIIDARILLSDLLCSQSRSRASALTAAAPTHLCTILKNTKSLKQLFSDVFFIRKL